MAGHSQTHEHFDRLSALAGGASAIWSAGSRGPWAHIQVEFVCEGGHDFVHAVSVTHKDVYGREESTAGRRSSSSKHPWPWKGGQPPHLHSKTLQKLKAPVSKRPRSRQCKRTRLTCWFATLFLYCLHEID